MKKALLLIIVCLVSITAQAQEFVTLKHYKVKVEFEGDLNGGKDLWVEKKFYYTIQQSGVTNSCKIEAPNKYNHSVVCDITVIERKKKDSVFRLTIRSFQGFGAVGRTKEHTRFQFTLVRTSTVQTNYGKFTISFMEAKK